MNRHKKFILLAGAALGMMISGAAAAESEVLEKGQKAYDEHCLTCHQADGRGVPGFQPPLVGGQWVNGDAQTLAAYVLTGAFNSAERKDSRAENVMPAFDRLDDETLAALLTYIRKEFGNDAAGPVSRDAIAAARKTVSQ